MLSNR